MHDVRDCFVIMPFHEKPDPARKDTVDFDRVYKGIIKPAIESLRKSRGLNIECLRCDEVERAGLIHERMVAHIADADVAVVDITTANPNVYYELGVRHALRDRVTVLVRRKGTNNPFNIGGMTTIEYDLDEESASRAREAIASFVANGLLSGARDSLVYAVLPGLKAGREPKGITESRVEEFDVPGTGGKLLGIVCGNLRDVNLGSALAGQPIDIWVNSENINMQMARPQDSSVSGLIRYLGARRDDTGAIVEDTIANELKSKMGRRQVVNPGEVVSTGAGTLALTHRVKRVYHAASVYGVVGTGWHGIASVDKCITNAMARADLEAYGLVDRDAAGAGLPAAEDEVAAMQPAPTSMLFPLLGAGSARAADLTQAARQQVGAALAYLRSRDQITCVKRVYFLAPNVAVYAALRVTMAELGLPPHVATTGAAPTARTVPAAAPAAPARAGAAGGPRKARRRPG
jgi:hypothetical protein